jgi:hypothetical protein
MRAGINQPTNQHFTLIFSMLKEVEQDEFEHTNMKRYKGWQTGSGDGSNLTVLQILRADSEYKLLQHLGKLFFWMMMKKTRLTHQMSINVVQGRQRRHLMTIKIHPT